MGFNYFENKFNDTFPDNLLPQLLFVHSPENRLDRND
jgi:hypothetical protein